MHWMMCAVAVCASLCSQAIAEEQPKARFLSRVSCTVVRYYVAQYTPAIAERWARGKGATTAEIETARRCLKVHTAQGPSFPDSCSRLSDAGCLRDARRKIKCQLLRSL